MPSVKLAPFRTDGSNVTRSCAPRDGCVTVMLISKLKGWPTIGAAEGAPHTYAWGVGVGARVAVGPGVGERVAVAVIVCVAAGAPV